MINAPTPDQNNSSTVETPTKATEILLPLHPGRAKRFARIAVTTKAQHRRQNTLIVATIIINLEEEGKSIIFGFGVL